MSKIIINKKKYFYNLSIILTSIKSKDELELLLKNNLSAYHIQKIAALAKEFRTKKLFVNKLKESLKNEKYFEKKLILLDNNFHTYSHTFHVTVNEIRNIFKVPKNTNLHLHFSAKMNRNYISKNQLKVLYHGVCEQKLNLSVIKIYNKNESTLSNHFYFKIRKFGLLKNEVKNICEQLFPSLKLLHFYNSIALFKRVNFNKDFVRDGIKNNAYKENNLTFNIIALNTIFLFFTKKNSTKVLGRNQTVRYKTYKNVTIPISGIEYIKSFAKIHDTISYKIINSLSTELERDIA